MAIIAIHWSRQIFGSGGVKGCRRAGGETRLGEGETFSTLKNLPEKNEEIFKIPKHSCLGHGHEATHF